MRIFLALLGISIAGIAAWFFLIRDTGPTSAEVTAFIKNQNPKLATAEVTLEGCELAISLEQASQDPPQLLRSLHRIDLSIFNLATAQVRGSSGQQLSLSFQMQNVPESWIDQAVKFIDLDPKDDPVRGGIETLITSRSGEPKVSRSSLRKYFAKPDAEIRMRLTTRVIEATNGQPAKIGKHEDGPAFHALAQKAAKLEKPMTVGIGLLYEGDKATADALLTGSITLAPQFNLQATSRENGKKLWKLLYDYGQANCSR
ncbi:MAG: hypothetical protein ACPGGK_11125 [Pikeienuella sp.]